MKQRKSDTNPIIKKEDLDKVRKSMSNYLGNDYPNWLIENSNFERQLRSIVRDELKNEVNRAPEWLSRMIRDIVSYEISHNLKVDVGGYGSKIDISLTYKGRTICNDGKYMPRNY